MKKMRVTKEIAQERMNEMGRDNFTIIEWNGTSKPTKVKCNKCGRVYTFLSGNSLYAKPNQYCYLESTCRNCVYIKSTVKSVDKARKQNKKINRIMKTIDKVKPILNKFLNDEFHYVLDILQDIEKVAKTKFEKSIVNYLIESLCDYTLKENDKSMIKLIKVYDNPNLIYKLRILIDSNNEEINRYGALVDNYKKYKKGEIEYYEMN